MTYDSLTKLIEACEALIKTWDQFMYDENAMNPLDYPIGELIDRVNDALREINVGARR